MYIIIAECQFPFYGDNCGSTCTCGRGSSGCDPVRGCVCMEGWQGNIFLDIFRQILLIEYKILNQ